MQLAWLSDIHMDFVDAAGRKRLYDDVVASHADAVLVGGDIAVASSLADELTTLADTVDRPVYFVLGNHDYYRSTIASVRNWARKTTSDPSINTFWLPATGVVSFPGTDTVLIGHGGWGDGREGDFFRSDVLLNDYLLIDELAEALGDIRRMGGDFPQSLFDKLNELGDEAATWFDSILPQALEQANHVIVLTHVPPFRESCWHAGRLSDDNWAPHFVCQAAGKSLRHVMQRHPEKRMTVLCGHTHGSGTADILPNLHVITAGADYGKPAVQSLIELS